MSPPELPDLDDLLPELGKLEGDERTRRIYGVIRELLGEPAETQQLYRNAITRERYITKGDWKEVAGEAKRTAATEQRRAADAEAEQRRNALIQQVSQDDRLMPPPSNPMAVARDLLPLSYVHDSRFILRRYRGGWVQWRRTHWAEAEDAKIEARAYEQLEHAIYIGDKGPAAWEPNRGKIADLLSAVGAIVHLPGDVNSPAWLGDTGPFDASHGVACTNGILDVTTRKLHTLTPDYFTFVSVPFGYQPAVPEPKNWLAFLRQLWPDDPDAVNALQEYFGYVLSGRTDMQKMLLLIGPTRSGKGTIARVLAALVGKGNVAAPTLAGMCTNFGLVPLIGKPLAIVGDARLGGADANQVVERLLSISGEDMLTIDRKYRESWTGTLAARFVIISNELPRFGDASGAIVNRFIVLNLLESFLGREDPDLTDTLTDELPGILNWALDGLERLARRGRFTVPQSSSDAILTLQEPGLSDLDVHPRALHGTPGSSGPGAGPVHRVEDLVRGGEPQARQRGDVRQEPPHQDPVGPGDPTTGQRGEPGEVLCRPRAT